MKLETIENHIIEITQLQGQILINPDSQEIEVTELPPIAEQYYLLSLDALSQASAYMELAKLYLEDI